MAVVQRPWATGPTGSSLPRPVSGGPCARGMIPLESPVREIRTPGSESGDEETWPW